MKKVIPNVRLSRFFLLISVLVLLAVSPQTWAAEYYEGKTIEVIVPFSPGGGSDVWIRTLSPYLEKYVRGNPRFLVRNIAAGRGIHGMNEFAAKGKGDGLHMVVSTASNYFPYLLGDKGVKYDFRKWKPLLVNPVGGVMYVSPGTGVKRVEDLAKAKGLVYAGISASGLDMIPLLSFDLLGLEVKSVLGYKGRGEARLAYEKGESNLDYQTTPAYNASVVPLIKEGKAIPLMSFGLLDDDGRIVRDPAVPDLPTVSEVHEKIRGKKPSGPVWEAYKAFMPLAFAVQKILWVKAEAPRETMNAFYEAADHLQKDAEFQGKAAEVLGGYPVFRGDRMEKTIQEAFQISPDAQNFVRDWLAKKYNVKLE